jgi:hypothetical protein
VSAHLTDFSYGHASLTKENAVKIRVPLSKLSGEDIIWVMEEMERRRRRMVERVENVGYVPVGATEREGKREAEGRGMEEGKGEEVEDGGK